MNVKTCDRLRLFRPPTALVIQALVRRLARLFHPQMVILFGSRAWGRPRRESDVDLMVVLHTRRDTADVAAEMAHAADAPFPLDIVVRTPGEVRRRLAEHDSFVSEVMERGKVLYEARHGRVG